eukprot:CAMPEP_0174845134 /NCGR_PEP_ID=MMETSP1114-20130205/11533_1 /TAXON_ID=312471 /ORGANISM="Neobodo designis, Strain CCAP 1951/1" /LENGTH=897 /DNA_ID=CAMNT_0016079381 /DNA_START=37 /DNA_END=2730 /DNA_ORIENTATION=+
MAQPSYQLNTGILELLAKCAADASQAPALWAAMDAEAPLGATLITALASRNFPVAGLDNLVAWMTGPDAPAERAADADALMAIVANAFITEAGFSLGSMGPPAPEGGMFGATIPRPRDLTTMLMNIAKAKAAACVMASGPYFVPDPADKGPLLASTTVLGAYLMSRNPFGNTAMNLQLLIGSLVEFFPAPKTVGPLDPQQEEKHRESEAQIKHAVTGAVTEFKMVVEKFLTAGAAARLGTFKFLSGALALCENHRVSMRKTEEEVPFIIVAILCHTCVLLSVPVFGKRSAVGGSTPWFPTAFPTEYFMQPENPAAFCAFGKDEERVITGDNAVPVPKRPTPAEYAPKVHLFALGVRALSVFVAPGHRHWRDFHRQLQYSEIKGRQRQAIAAMCGLHVALLSDEEMVPNYFMIADAVAEWLISVLDVRRDGTFARPVRAKQQKGGAGSDDDGAAAASPYESVPDSFALWANLPLTLLDDVYSTTKLLDGFGSRRPPPEHITFFQLRHMAALMLVVMGDADAFPKNHTHAMFPRFFAVLTEPRMPFRTGFMNHEWFAVHAMRACVEGYIIVQPCDHDRAEARYFLALALKDLLKDGSLAESVKAKYNDDKDETLESLSSMVTAEATGSLDHVFEALGTMRAIELDNNRAEPSEGHPKYAEHQQQGHMLQWENVRAISAIDVFDALTQHFRRGMAKRLVVQQISGALMNFLIRLAGPTAFELKIANPGKYRFNPRDMLTRIVHNFVKFAGSDKFRRFAVQSQTSLAQFDAAVRFILDRHLVPSDDAERLEVMAQRMRESAAAIAEEDRLLEDAPDWARCAVMYDPLKDPVALPTTSSDLTFVERGSIRHHLLSEKIHPFTREPLTMADVEAFNAKPEVQAQIEDLKRRIAAWLADATAKN